MTTAPLAVAPGGAATSLAEANRAATEAMRRGVVREALAIMAPHATRVVDSTEPDVVLAAAILIECHLALGDVPAASAVAAAVPRGDDAPQLAWIEYARGEVCTALGDTDRAAEHYRTSGRLGADELVPCSPWRIGLALTLAGRGRSVEAEELAREQVSRARAVGHPLGVALALRALAIAGPGGTRVVDLRQALAAAEESGNIRIVRQLQADLAGMLVLTGENAEAVELLRLVEEFAARETLWPLHSRARRFLELLGERPLRLESETLALLTAAEQRVAVLALDGHPNREIAERLTVSVKAVESHLSRIYRKVGVSSRSGLLTSVAR